MLKKHLISKDNYNTTQCGLKVTRRRLFENRIVSKKQEATCQYCNPPEKV